MEDNSDTQNDNNTSTDWYVIIFRFIILAVVFLSIFYENSWYS